MNSNHLAKLLIIPILFVALFLSGAEETAKPRPISLTEIEGRSWLLDSEGQPFFGHGITHAGHREATYSPEQFLKACQDIGFNAMGYGSPLELRDELPFFETCQGLVPFSTYTPKKRFGFVDVFDPKVQAGLVAKVKLATQRSRGNPNLIGYFWSDLGAWPLKNSTGRNWVDYIRSLPEDAPGRAAYRTFLKDWQGGTEKERDTEFLRLIARTHFRVLGEALRQRDPDALVFGERFSFATLEPIVVEELLPWVDAIAIQPPFRAGFPKEKFDEIHALTGKPIVICDFAIRFKDGDKDVRHASLEPSAAAAGAAYTDYVKSALDTDYILGVFWCNPVDTSRVTGKSGVKQGFFKEGLTPRPGLAGAVQELNEYRDAITPKNW